MGTDIHAFVEVDYASDGEPFGELAEVRSFNFGEFFVWQNYDLFDPLRMHGRSVSKRAATAVRTRWASNSDEFQSR